MNGKQIKALRRRLKMSQAEFAKAIGLTEHAIYSYESGRRKPRRPTVALIRMMWPSGARAHG